MHRWLWVTSRLSGKSKKCKRPRQPPKVDQEGREVVQRIKERVTRTTVGSIRRPFHSFPKIMTNWTRTSMTKLPEVRKKRLVTSSPRAGANTRVWANRGHFVRAMFHLVVNLATTRAKPEPLSADPKWPQYFQQIPETSDHPTLTWAGASPKTTYLKLSRKFWTNNTISRKLCKNSRSITSVPTR